MSEIRFNQPELKEEKKEKKEKKFLIFLGISVVLILIVFLIFLSINLFGADRGNRDEYSAVFLTNGQVYFGKIIKNNNNEIVLNDVYYLQANTGGVSEQGISVTEETSFNLVKLGSELHGPTDELFVNKSQITVYQYLRGDSSVVQSIKKQQLE